MPGFTTRSSLDDALSVAVATKLPALVVSTANVNEPFATRLVVVPLFAELKMPLTELIVSADELRIFTAPALLTKDKLETVVFRAVALAIPLLALAARLPATTSVMAALVPETIAPEAMRVTVFPGAEIALDPEAVVVVRLPPAVRRLIAPLVVVASVRFRFPPPATLVALIEPVPVTLALNELV